MLGSSLPNLVVRILFCLGRGWNLFRRGLRRGLGACLGLGLSLGILLLDSLTFECCQLATVDKQLLNQPALRVDRVPLLDNQHAHHAVGDHKKYRESREQGNFLLRLAQRFIQ